MGKIKQILHSTYMYSLAAKGVHIVLGLLGTVFVNRFLGAELKGEYAYIINIINILFTIFNLGIYQSYPMNRRKKIENITYRYINLILKQFVIYVLIGIVLIPCLHFAGVLDDGYTIIIAISYTYLVLNILSHQVSMIASVEMFRARAKAFIFAEFVQFALLACMYVFMSADIIMPIVIGIIYFIVYIILCLKKLKVKINLREHDKQFARQTLKNGIFPTLFTLFLSLNYRLDIIFLKQYVGTEVVSSSDVGLYSVGVQLAQYAWIVPDIFKEVLFNKTSKKDSINEIMYCAKISILTTLLFMATVLLFGDWIITLLYGKEFAGAATITKIIFTGIISMCVFKILNPLYNAKGKFFENFIILFMSILINVVLNVILIPLYGSIGAAIASVIGYVVCSVVYLYRFKKDYNLKTRQILFITLQDIKDVKKLLINKTGQRKKKNESCKTC